MDIIIANAVIHTMDEKMPVAQAIAVDKGLVRYTGDNDSVLSHKSKETEIIDAKGRLIIPGFNDSHMHLLGYAATKSGADLTNARSVSDVVRLLSEYIKEKGIKDGETVIGNGFNENIFADNQMPTGSDLDKTSTRHPILIKRACRHLAVANSAMLEKSGITSSTKIEGGQIFLDSGVLTENAMDLAVTFDETFSAERMKELILSVSKELAELGITSVQTDDFYPMFPKENVLRAYRELARKGRLTFRVTEQCKAISLGDLDIVLNLPEDGALNNLFRLGPVKILQDGSLGARTAYMQEDYHDDKGNRGVAIFDQETLNHMIELVHKNGRDAAVHAIGDGAVLMVQNAVRKTQSELPRNDAKHGIVHAQITTDELLSNFAELGMMAYIQPIFIRADSAILESRVGKAKAATSYAFKEMFDKGVKIPIGTDCPVEPLNPFDNLYYAVKSGLSVHEAVLAYTAHGAYASREEDVKGKIAPGYFADLVMLSDNIFTCSTEEIKETKAVMTIFGGSVIYAAE